MAWGSMTVLHWKAPDGFPFQELVKDRQLFPVDQQRVWQEEGPAWSHLEFFQRWPHGRVTNKGYDTDHQKTAAEEKVSTRGKNQTLQGSCGQRLPAGKALMDSETHPQENESALSICRVSSRQSQCESTLHTERTFLWTLYTSLYFRRVSDRRQEKQQKGRSMRQEAAAPSALSLTVSPSPELVGVQ